MKLNKKQEIMIGLWNKLNWVKGSIFEVCKDDNGEWKDETIDEAYSTFNEWVESTYVAVDCALSNDNPTKEERKDIDDLVASQCAIKILSICH